MTNHSPVPKKKETKPEIKSVEMTFPEAIKKIIEGRKVTRPSWNAKDYGFISHNVLAIHRSDSDSTYSWIVNDGDLFAEDWVVVKEVLN